MLILNIKSFNINLCYREKDKIWLVFMCFLFLSLGSSLTRHCPAFLLAAGGVGPSAPAASEGGQRLRGSSGNQTRSAENRHRGIAEICYNYHYVLYLSV